MKIAVTYEDGQIFQHFGRTENFKVYDVEDGAVAASEVVPSNGVGHGALAGLLAELGVNVLICGGIGGGAQSALEEAGIELCAGASGDVDEAVRAFLAGELVNTGSNCDHHHGEGEEHHCGHHEGGHCGHHGQGGCGHCGHHSAPEPVEGTNIGKTVRVHYRGTFNDGEQFDSSYDRDEPLEFVCGAGQMIGGFDYAVAHMQVGEEVDVHLMPGEAYGQSDPNAIMTFKFTDLPGSEGLELGQRVYLRNMSGQSFPVRVTAKTEDSITLDANHEMAGKELNFHIQLLSAE